MIRVNILCEDRTGTGLAQVIESAAQARRAAKGKPPLRFARQTGTIGGNTQLLEQCAKYELLRFRRPPHYDHVFYVMDAYKAWDLRPRIIESPPPKNHNDLEPYLEQLAAAVGQEMKRRACGRRSDTEWQTIESGFHPHVLVWERESLILPVSDAFDLGDPPVEPLAERHAARWIAGRLREHRGENYAKAIHGPQILETIARSSELRERVLAATPSLAAIVNELASI